MSKINVSLLSKDPKADPLKLLVELVDDDDSKSTHQVQLSQELYQRLTGGLKSAEEFVRYSFEFLLEREPKEQILKIFDLSEIQKYFPEYEAVISAQLAK